MKIVGSILLAILFGLILGGWGPRRDLKEAQREIEALKARINTGGGRGAGLDGIAALLHVPERSDKTTRDPTGGPAVTPGPAETNWISGQDRTPRPGRTPGTNSSERVDFRERIQTAAELWKVRRDLARNSFMSRVKPTPEAAARVDVIMQAMNVRLEESVSRWVEYIKEAEDLSPEDGVRIMNELSGIVVMTYDDLDRTLPEAWRDQAGEKFQVFDFINPEVVLPLADVEGILNRPGRARFQPPPPAP